MKYELVEQLTYAEAEAAYRSGEITDDQWEYYQWEWRNSAPRFSNIAIEHEGKKVPCERPE